MKSHGWLEPVEPDLRATYFEGHLWVARWRQNMVTPDELRKCLAKGVEEGEYLPVLFDIYRLEDDREISVQPQGNEGYFSEAEEHLLVWAAQAGYRRIWMPGDHPFRDLRWMDDPMPAEVLCPCCSMIYDWDNEDFWAKIARDGFMDAPCPTCGTQLPQWTHAGGRLRIRG